MNIIVNCAMTADGKLATKERKQLAISSPEDMKRVHELRASVDAILVGVGTVLADDPKLTVKESYVPGAKNPVRIVLDSKGRTPHKARVLNGDADTIIYTTCVTVIPGATVVALYGEEKVPLGEVMKDLEERGFQSLLVEGGGEMIWSFFNEGLVDEYHVFIGSQIVGGRTSPTPADGEGRNPGQGGITLELVSSEKLGDGILLSYKAKL